MTRNTYEFSANPTYLDMSRSTFDRSHSVKTSFNAGLLVPFYVDEVLPGDTFDVRTSKVVRMPSLVTPVMDNLFLDTYYFFVPNRIVWNHWKELQGENTDSAWAPSIEYEVPQLRAPEGGWSVGTIADYFGIPTGVSGISVNALPFRGYALICQEWFRDQNLTDPLEIPKGDATVNGVNTGNYIMDVAKGGIPFYAAKKHDYFTSALPGPQKGPDVTIPVTQPSNLPVMALADQTDPSLSPVVLNRSMSGGTVSDFGYMRNPSLTNLTTHPASSFSEASSSAALADSGVYPLNLWAIQSGDAAAATINDLRQAFQIQKMYERDARGGTRYREILRAHFGVTSPDATQQVPEYLGGNSVPITISQVLQSSPTSGSPQGNPTGQSLTTDVNNDFKSSFTEHGFVIGVMCVRYKHTYQQGIERFWSRKDRLDYYMPVYANLGEMPILNKEIYAQGSAQDDEVFGYQEAWADYRYKPSHVTGHMRSQYAQSLDSWHIADYYDQLPSLSDGWIREDPSNIDRIIAVTSEVSNQFFADIYISNRCRRVMPLYSIPGLIDHH